MARHKGCPCCPSRNRGLGKYTWQVLELDGTERWRKVTVPDGTTFTPEGYPNNWYRHGWKASEHPGHEAGGVLLTSYAVMVEWGAEVGLPFSFIVTSRDIANGDLVAILELGPLDRFLGRLGPDRVAILRVESVYAPDRWRIEVYDGELHFEWETATYDSTATDAAGFTVPALKWELGYASGVLALLRYDGFTGLANNWSLVTFQADGTAIGDSDVSSSQNLTHVNFFTGGNGLPGTGGMSLDGTAVVLWRGTSTNRANVMSIADGSFLGYYYIPNLAGGYPEILNSPYVLWSSTQASGLVTVNPTPTNRGIVGTGLFDSVDWYYALTLSERPLDGKGRVVWASPDVYFIVQNTKVQRWTQGTMDFELAINSPAYNHPSVDLYFAVSEDVLIVPGDSNPRRILVVDTGVVTFDGAVDDFFALGSAESLRVCDASATEILQLHQYRANDDWGGRACL